MLLLMTPIDEGRNELLKEIFALKPERIVNQLQDIVFEETKCALCEQSPITGPLVKCDDCVGFNMCWRCYKSGKEAEDHKANHAVIVNLLPIKYHFDMKDVQVLKKLGKGYFGSVSQVIVNNHKPAALKTLVVKKNIQNPKELKSFFNETKAYSELVSFRIIKYYGQCVEEFEDETRYYLLLEFMDGGSVQDIINTKKPKSLRRRLQWMQCY